MGSMALVVAWLLSGLGEGGAVPGGAVACACLVQTVISGGKLGFVELSCGEMGLVRGFGWI